MFESSAYFYLFIKCFSLSRGTVFLHNRPQLAKWWGEVGRFDWIWLWGRFDWNGELYATRDIIFCYEKCIIRSVLLRNKHLHLLYYFFVYSRLHCVNLDGRHWFALLVWVISKSNQHHIRLVLLLRRIHIVAHKIQMNIIRLPWYNLYEKNNEKRLG